MSDQTPQEEQDMAPVKETAAESIEMPGVAAPENAQVGDENIADVHEVEVDVNKDSVPAQTTGKPAVEVDQVYVHETSVMLDRVITDPHSPEAVQIPDAGRGTLDLPIHALDAETPEAFFAREASKSDD